MTFRTDPAAGISFGRGVGWHAMSKKSAEREAKDSRLPLYVRVRSAAVARADRMGHAQFLAGELRDWLDAPSASSVSNAIRRAVDLGLLKAGSGARCLVLAHYDWQSGLSKGTPTCLIHDQVVSPAVKRDFRDKETANRKPAGQDAVASSASLYTEKQP